MIAFKGDTLIRKAVKDRVKECKDAGKLKKFLEWDDVLKEGGIVGCMLGFYDPDAFESEIGLPNWLGHCADRIFNGLPQAQAVLFPDALIDAIKKDAEMDPMKGHFLLKVQQVLAANISSLSANLLAGLETLVASGFAKAPNSTVGDLCDGVGVAIYLSEYEKVLRQDNASREKIDLLLQNISITIDEPVPSIDSGDRLIQIGALARLKREDIFLQLRSALIDSALLLV